MSLGWVSRLGKGLRTRVPQFETNWNTFSVMINTKQKGRSNLGVPNIGHMSRRVKFTKE